MDRRRDGCCSCSNRRRRSRGRPPRPNGFGRDLIGPAMPALSHPHPPALPPFPPPRPRQRAPQRRQRQRRPLAVPPKSDLCAPISPRHPRFVTTSSKCLPRPTIQPCAVMLGPPPSALVALAHSVRDRKSTR